MFLFEKIPRSIDHSFMKPLVLLWVACCCYYCPTSYGGATTLHNSHQWQRRQQRRLNNNINYKTQQQLYQQHQQARRRRIQSTNIFQTSPTSKNPATPPSWFEFLSPPPTNPTISTSSSSTTAEVFSTPAPQSLSQLNPPPAVPPSWFEFLTPEVPPPPTSLPIAPPSLSTSSPTPPDEEAVPPSWFEFLTPAETPSPTPSPPTPSPSSSPSDAPNSDPLSEFSERPSPQISNPPSSSILPSNHPTSSSSSLPTITRTSSLPSSSSPTPRATTIAPTTSHHPSSSPPPSSSFPPSLPPTNSHSFDPTIDPYNDGCLEYASNLIPKTANDMPIGYIYELVYDDDQNSLATILSSLEEEMVDDLSRSLLNCGRRGGERRRRVLMSDYGIVGYEAKPLDEVTSDPCINLFPTSSSTKCVTIHGLTTAYLTANPLYPYNEILAREETLLHLRDAMTTNSYVNATRGIESLYYMGATLPSGVDGTTTETLESEGPAAAETTQDGTPVGEGLTTIGVTLCVLAGVGVVGVLLWLNRGRKRRRLEKKDEKKKREATDDELLERDLEESVDDDDDASSRDADSFSLELKRAQSSSFDRHDTSRSPMDNPLVKDFLQRELSSTPDDDNVVCNDDAATEATTPSSIRRVPSSPLSSTGLPPRPSPLPPPRVLRLEEESNNEITRVGSTTTTSSSSTGMLSPATSAAVAPDDSHRKSTSSTTLRKSNRSSSSSRRRQRQTQREDAIAHIVNDDDDLDDDDNHLPSNPKLEARQKSIIDKCHTSSSSSTSAGSYRQRHHATPLSSSRYALSSETTMSTGMDTGGVSSTQETSQRHPTFLPVTSFDALDYRSYGKSRGGSKIVVDNTIEI